jgi:hypothetical protein
MEVPPAKFKLTWGNTSLILSTKQTYGSGLRHHIQNGNWTKIMELENEPGRG